MNCLERYMADQVSEFMVTVQPSSGSHFQQENTLFNKQNIVTGSWNTEMRCVKITSTYLEL